MKKFKFFIIIFFSILFLSKNVSAKNNYYNEGEKFFVKKTWKNLNLNLNKI